MPCNHRFINDLLPSDQLKYLFVGTFNPSWNRPQNDDANWFYGRKNNDFWFLMPQIFESESLMAREYRTNRQYLMNWCLEQNVGLTDLIQSIEDADINNSAHRDIILSVNDNGFDSFNQIIPTNINDLIEQNRETLLGVYLTRYEHTLSENGIVKNLWRNIQNQCLNLNIHCHDLVTPSRQFRSLTRLQKLDIWRQTIIVEH